MSGFELVITVASPRELAATDLSACDAVCLGNPYCRRVEGNFAEEVSLLRPAVEGLHAAGKRAYVTSPAAPRGRDMPQVDRLIEAAAAAGADALEVHNMGVLRRLREKGNPLPVHMGAFANVYTHLGAKVMKEYGAVRVRPNAEVSLEEMAVIAREAGIDVEVLVHGKIPLGVTDRCFLLKSPEETDPNCPAACREERWLLQDRVSDARDVSPRGDETPVEPDRSRPGPGGRAGGEGLVLKMVGKGILSGKDMCLIEHLPSLREVGFYVFRIEGLYEEPAYRGELSAAYREALSLALSGEPYAVRPGWIEAVKRHTRRGLCNGYAFGKAGRLYLGSVLQDIDPGV